MQRSPSPPDEAGPRLLFILGAPRSGTTLLMRLLAAHPRVLARPEPHLMTPLAYLGYFDHVGSAPYDPLVTHLAIRHFVAGLPRGEDDYVDAVRAYCDTLYGRMLAASGRDLFVDKTPAYALISPFLERIYPDARYVVITRHPGAIFSSHARAFFDDDWHAAHAFHPLLERYVPAIAAFLRRSPSALHLRYETLVTDPQGACRALCAHAGLADHPPMVAYGEVPVAGLGPGDPGVDRHQRPTPRYLDAWRDAVEAAPGRRALLEQILEELSDPDLRAFGVDRHTFFEPSRAEPSPPRPHRGTAERWSGPALRRRVLLRLRRGASDPRTGRVLRQIRFYCDVLLRESVC
ncbi:MAG TPA: sulfotransferase [Deltaproteobacteria bacterium]|nr:sulfotransferase [Deltaproteobacteria bacterium]